MTELFLLVSASIEVILVEVFLDLVVIATGLGGAVTLTSYKWAY
jgi:bacteriorhodopsin